MRASFLSTEADDQALEDANRVFWDTLVGHIRADGFSEAPRTIVDIGSHRGGLLEHVARLWGPTTLYGIEPVAALRKRALFRLRSQAREVEMLDPSDLARIPNATVNLLIAFESLYLVEDLDAFFDHVSRVLRHGGRAYIALGCHGENPVWKQWKPRLEAMGHVVTTHQPLEIMRAGAVRNLLPSVRPLRDYGWVTHDPRDAFSFETVDQMLDHHFKHKLLFRFVRS